MAGREIGLLVATLLICVVMHFAIVTSARTGDPPPAIARLCFNQVVHADDLKPASQQILSEGCESPIFVQVDKDHFLAYGVRVLIGE